MQPDGGLVRTYRRSYFPYTILVDSNTLTRQSSGTSNAPRDLLKVRNSPQKEGGDIKSNHTPADPVAT